MRPAISCWDDEERTTSPGMNHVARALVCEDDAEMRALVVAVLEGDGWQVSEAASGTEMLEVLREQGDRAYPEDPFDVIVTDVRMPGPSGMEVVARLREGGCETPVIVMTAFPDEHVVAATEGLDAILLSKPFSFDALRSASRSYAELGPFRRRSRTWLR
jgi:CheY-like chemotaxis protein